MNEKALLSVEEARKYLRISKGKMYQLVHQKDFPAVWIGRIVRIPKGALDQWIEKQAAGK